jgi:hypothetical protein
MVRVLVFKKLACKDTGIFRVKIFESVYVKNHMETFISTIGEIAPEW